MDYAVLVGINNYPYPNQLQGCIDDMLDIKTEIEAALNFKKNNVLLIKDQDATAVNIKQILKNTINKLQQGDRFLFWYSGHGAQLIDGDAGTDVICPIDFDFTPETSVTVDDFHNIFTNIPDGVTAIWGSDSCHSGDLEKDFYKNGVPKLFRKDRSKEEKKIINNIKQFRDISVLLPNITLISGCRSDQTSADAHISGRYNGAFTYYFLQQLRQPNGLKTPLDTLVPEIQNALNTAGYSQIPQLSGPPKLTTKPFLAFS